MLSPQVIQVLLKDLRINNLDIQKLPEPDLIKWLVKQNNNDLIQVPVLFALYKEMLKTNDTASVLILWEKLLAAGIDIGKKNKETGNTLLMDLVSYGYVMEGFQKALSMLIARGADVNATNNNGMTPLMLAAKQGTGSTVTLLLNARANPMAKNNDGQTAADIALAEKTEATETAAIKNYEGIVNTLHRHKL